MANATKLFYTTTDPEHYLANLDPVGDLLKAARTEIRAHLRTVFSAASKEFFGRTITPRFFTQGSCAYKTLNDPAWPPVQQKDLDDGCYLPLSFVRGARPSTAAKLFFEFVDTALIALAKRHGWRHESKPTCVRLVIAQDAHIDIPLYAIPDTEFVTLQDKVAISANARVATKSDTWEELPADAVLLAHREEDWIQSDPRKIRNWFLDMVDIYGEQLRRDCRYMKGWRDYNRLDDYKLTSILLMVCVWQAYEEIGGPYLRSREDERLLQVLEKLPKYLKGPVRNPANPLEDINRIPEEHRARVIAKVEALAACLRTIGKDCEEPSEAVEKLRGCFGRRVPDRPDLVTIPATLVSKVMAQPKRIHPAPEVGRSVSG